MRASLGHPSPFDNQKFAGFAYDWDREKGLNFLNLASFSVIYREQFVSRLRICSRLVGHSWGVWLIDLGFQ
jgi:hypothetical protein